MTSCGGDAANSVAPVHQGGRGLKLDSFPGAFPVASEVAPVHQGGRGLKHLTVMHKAHGHVSCARPSGRARIETGRTISGFAEGILLRPSIRAGRGLKPSDSWTMISRSPPVAPVHQGGRGLKRQDPTTARHITERLRPSIRAGED